MLSLDKCRKIQPRLKNLSNERAFELVEELYDLAELALENWVKEKNDSKNLEWLLSNKKEGVK